MYNRYINSGGFEALPKPSEQQTTEKEDALKAGETPAFESIASEKPPPPPQKSKSLLGGLFGNNIKLPEFNADTIVLLVLVYFLVADSTRDKEKKGEEAEKDKISDTLLIIGALLLLGF